jgi:hypothetical protein
MAESFWQIPDVSDIRTPLSILREQAAALTEQTKGQLVGVVETKSEGDDLRIALEIAVPALNDYRYRILSYHQPVELYPGWLDAISLTQIPNEQDFINAVRDTLSSPRTRNVLTSLLAQVTEA